MLASFRIPILFGQAKVNDVNIVLPFADPHQKVVWLDVSVKVKPTVDVFDSLDHLVSQHQNSF
jgi:hypothetical protein